MISDIRLHSRSGLKFGSLASSYVLEPWRTRRVFIFRGLAPSRSLISSATKMHSCPSMARAFKRVEVDAFVGFSYSNFVGQAHVFEESCQA